MEKTVVKASQNELAMFAYAARGKRSTQDIALAFYNAMLEQYPNSFDVEIWRIEAEKIECLSPGIVPNIKQANKIITDWRRRNRARKTFEAAKKENAWGKYLDPS